MLTRWTSRTQIEFSRCHIEATRRLVEISFMDFWSVAFQDAPYPEDPIKLYDHMGTPAPDINPRAMRAVDIVDSAAF